ncbi:MAG: GIY-YIG nuclease family protein [Bacteroidetes bacterium]|nr:GIY-YIG nuclease family protein [Bacteroidota bacterium]
MYYLYILYSETSDLYYVGYTNDYERRLIEHNTSDKNTFTSKHRPWELAAAFSISDNEAEAMMIEKFIKKQKSRKFLEALINAKEMTGILAQLVRVPKLRD